MGKNIIIAEKPSVGREYARVLGVMGSAVNGYLESDRWIVTWTVGHLVTMAYPEKYDAALKEWKLETLPFIPKQYKYEPIKETYKQLNIVKNLYNRSDIDVIYYAGDAGREGLYIQMLVRQFVGHSLSAKEKVVWIDSQTDAEVLRGISEAKDLKEYTAMSDAGYMRAIEDYSTGINFSRLLSVKYAAMLNSGSGQKKHKPISVGRVMTCVLGMIVNREREIRDFRVTNFYRIAAIIDINGSKIECEWKDTVQSRYHMSPKLYSEFGFLKEQDAKEMIGGLDADIRISSVTRNTERKTAPLLFNLAELQGECTKKLRISPGETLKTVQSLYEKKLTTYPRTDARVLTNAIADEINKNLSGLEKGAYKQYVSSIGEHHWKLGSKYIDDSKVTDHYAIIPTGVLPVGLSEREAAVYDMICRRFLAAFYPAAEYERIRFEAAAGTERFFGTSKFLTVSGYYDVAGMPENDNNSQELVDTMGKLCQGNSYPVEYEMRRGETAPPRRYTSGSMILAMENAGTLIEDDELREQIKANGIGTSATRADVIDKLIRLNYIALNEKKQILTPTEFGEMVFEVVHATLPELLLPEMTAKWERGLEQIASGVISKESYEKELYSYIRKECEKIKEMDNADDIVKKIRPFATNRIELKYKEFDAFNTRILCPLCGDEVETTRWGFKCRSNINKNEGCTFAIGDVLGHFLLTNELKLLLEKGKAGPFYDFVSQKGKVFAANLLWNDEKKKIEFEMVDMPWEETKMCCPICGKKIIKQNSFYKCESHIDKEQGCKFWIGKIMGKSISEKMAEQLIKNGRTELIKGFKNAQGAVFDAFLIWNAGEQKISFEFPTQSDIETKLFCPICNGKILTTPYGFKCQNYKKEEDGCSFSAGTILGHKIKEKELQQILSGGMTELVSMKNKDKKSFEARLYWNQGERRIDLRFDDNIPQEIDIKCPICNSPLQKTKYGYLCSKNISGDEKCRFRMGSIAGVLPDEKQLSKLVNQGRTDLISGFKPKTKGKQPFCAYLVWNPDEQKIVFEFPNKDASKEISNYVCPACHKEKLYKTPYSYRCDCGFRLDFMIAGKTLSDEQIKKILIKGESDLIPGFLSMRTRKRFSAKLVVEENGVRFVFTEGMKNEKDKFV